MVNVYMGRAITVPLETNASMVLSDFEGHCACFVAVVVSGYR